MYICMSNTVMHVSLGDTCFDRMIFGSEAFQSARPKFLPYLPEVGNVEKAGRFFLISETIR